MEKGMLLSTDMVRATLDNRKTMTRRLNGLKEINESPNDWAFTGWKKDPGIIKICNGRPKTITRKGLHAVFQNKSEGFFKYVKCPWEPGDILWFRETHTEIDGEVFYFADGYPDIELHDRFEQPNNKKIKWKPSLFMPRDVARLFGEIQDIRIVRLQDITEEDARAEGCIDFHDKIGGGKFDDVVEFDLTARDAFAELWTSTIKKQDLNKFGWGANPWVWVIEFERVNGGDR